MPKPKPQNPAKPSGPADPPAPSNPTTQDIAPTQLTSEEWALIDKASTFLFRIPAYAAQAKLQGYDDEEHTLGKRLVEKASGRDRPLWHWTAEDAHAAAPSEFTAEQTRLLQEIDAFENLWFPRVRAMLQRCIPDERQERFIGAFFKNLSQQPLGPGVLDSVETLVTRFEQLAKSDEPGAKETHKLGTKRGLTPQKIAEVRKLIAAAREALPKKVPAGIVSAEDLAKAQQEQREALRQLRRWYNDWAATFRGVFGTRVLVRLGLATLKRPARGEEEPADDEEPIDEGGQGDEAGEDDEAEADEEDEEAGEAAAKPAAPKAPKNGEKPAKNGEKAAKGGGKAAKGGGK